MDSKEKREKVKRRAEAERCRDLGNFYFKNGHYEQAISAYLEGLFFLEEDYLLHCNLAQAFIKVKQYNRACCHASAAIELNPTFWKSYARLAKALYETGQKVESYEVLMQGFVICDQKEELQKCFYHIPATSDEEANVKAAKKLKRLVTDESRRLMGEEAKKSKKTKEKKKMENNQDAEPAQTTGDTAPTTAPIKTESTQKKPVDSQDIKKKPVDSQEIKKKPVDFQDIKNDQFLAFAEKSSHEVYSGQKKEFEAFLKEGYEEAQKEAFTKALECYRKALKIREEVPLKYLGLQDKHCLVITYILNLMRIKTNTFENLQQTIHDLKAIDEVGEFQILPAFYYIRSLAYLKMNRFKAALEELDSCNELLSYRRSFPFKEYCWPSTTVIIKETTKEGLQQAINDLITQAKSGLLIVPTAVCRYIQCHEVSSHILPSEQIFLTDPDFVGYVTITCEEKCHIQYHLHCWKAYRERMSEFEKIADKDMLGRPCPTTDCLNSAGNHSTILMVEIYDQDGAVKSQIVQKLSKTNKKKEDNKPEEKKPKEKVPKARKPTVRKKSVSDKKSADQKSSIAQKKETEEIFNGKMAQLINLRAINFGCAFNSWNPNEAFYGRSDEKEVCNSFVQKRVDNPLFVPDQNDQMTIIRMKFYKLLRKETFLPIDAIEEYWNDDDEFSCETRNSLKSQGIVDFLLQSTIFALLDDLMCTSENLPEAYKETEESLEQSMAFMIEGFLENVNESEDKKDSKEINENNDKFEHDTDEDDVEEDIDYSESAEISDVESSVCDESSDSEYSQSEVDDQIEVKSIDVDKSPDDKKDIQNDCPVASANNEDFSCTPKSPVQNGECSEQYSGESDETIVCTDDKSNDVIPEKIMLEQSVQTDADEENSAKNVIENLKKKIDLFNENLNEKNEKIDTLKVEISKISSLNQIMLEQSVQTDADEENSAKNVIENLKKKIDLFNENLNEKNEKIDTLKVEISKISSLNQKLEIENGKLLDQKEKLNKKLTNQSTLFKKKEAELTKEMELTEKSCLEKLAVLQNYVETLLMNCKEKCSVYEQNQSKLEQAVAMLEKENAMLKLSQSESSVTRTFNNNYSTNNIELEEASRSESDENVEDNVEEYVEEDVEEDVGEDVGEDVEEDVEEYVGEDVEEDVEEYVEESAQVYVDDSASSNHLMNGLSSSESTQDEVAQSEASDLSNYVEPQDEGIWETSSRHSNHSKSDVVLTTSIVRKKKFNLLRDSLVKLNPAWTESEVEECIRIVRVRNNNSLTGLPMTEISARVRVVLDERARKPSTMGLDKFTKVGWCQNKATDNIWSGNIELEDCIICSEEIEDRKHLTTLDCHHYFHTECIRKWLKEKSICPLCTTFTKMPDEFPAL